MGFPYKEAIFENGCGPPVELQGVPLASGAVYQWHVLLSYPVMHVSIWTRAADDCEGEDYDEQEQDNLDH